MNMKGYNWKINFMKFMNLRLEGHKLEVELPG